MLLSHFIMYYTLQANLMPCRSISDHIPRAHLKVFPMPFLDNVLLQCIYFMKRQPYNNLRFSQKIRESECFIEADGLQKKIRKFNAGKAESVNAEVKMREIECFWKEGWEYNHTHHIYLEPKVTKPQFYLPLRQRYPQQLKPYYQLLTKFLNRLRTDNEDETNYKIEPRQCLWQEEEKKEMKEENQESKIEEKMHEIMEFQEFVNDQDIAKAALNHLLKTFGQLSEQMTQNFRRSMKYEQNMMSMSEGLTEDKIVHLQPILTACSYFLTNQQAQQCQQTRCFMRQVMGIIEEAKTSKQYSAVLGTQPLIGQLAGTLHPLCWALYALFSKELLVKEAKKVRGRRYADEREEPLKLKGSLLRKRLEGLQLLQIKDDFRVEEERHSKVVLLNLDGYESQFTLQWARNFSDNLMYVSFPNYEQASLKQRTEHMQLYRHRFYKKIMFNYTRSELDILGYPEGQHVSLTLQRDQLSQNPEKYHETIDQLYPSPNSYPPPDFNRNMFVFPIGLDLHSEQQMSGDRHVEGYQSELIRFILRDQLYAAMKAFRPHIILISYSGKLSIQTLHFVEMMQELIKVCPKVVFFPNLTAATISPKDLHFQTTTHTINLMDEAHQDSRTMIMERLSIFLKVSAGYYSLIRPFEQEELDSRYRNSRVFPCVIYLYASLKNEYEQCRRRVESSTLKALKASLEATLQEHSRQISRCIPLYYKRLFTSMKALLDGTAQLGEYEALVEEVKDRFPPSYQQDEPHLRQWQELQRAEELRLASAKYHEVSQVHIRQKPSREEYLSIKDERMSSLQNYYRISFYYREQSNQIVKLYSDVGLLWREDQQGAIPACFPLVLTNLFTPSEDAIRHYIAKPKLSKQRRLQRCQIIPAVFHSTEGVIEPAHPFEVWSDWNYAETEHNVLLYWPSRFDFINNYFSRLLSRPYEPPLIPRIFAAVKSGGDTLGKTDGLFYEVRVMGDSVPPRWGCSSFSLQDQLFIMGGSYGREKSYLELQNDVTTLDLTGHSLHDFSPVKLRNLKQELYANEAFWGKLRERRPVNSFVRPRHEFQFYWRDELILQEEEKVKGEEDYKRLYMIGGYGEEFKAPYSLFVNCFYEITVEVSTRRLVSILRRVIPGQAVPINVREMMRNRGVYNRGNILEDEGEKDQVVKDGITNNSHYIHHRIVYALKSQQLQFKIKTLFATPLYSHSNRDFESVGRRLGVGRREEKSEPVVMRKVEGCRHQVMLEIGHIYYLFSLNLQLQSEQEQMPLTNEAVIAIDTRGLLIYALLSLPTQRGCLLATETVVLPQQEIMQREKHFAIVLKGVTAFEERLGLHCLLICNANQIALLHGIAFEECQPKEYLIKTKIKSQLPVLCVSRNLFTSITTFFTKKNNIVTAINLLQANDESRSFTIARLSLDVNRFGEGWKTCGQVERAVLMQGNTLMQRVRIEARIDHFADVNSIVLLLHSNNRTYHLMLADVTANDSRIELQELTDQPTAQRYRFMEPLPKVFKSEELYSDFNYFP